jgi:hypothetical protein
MEVGFVEKLDDLTGRYQYTQVYLVEIGGDELHYFVE